MGGFQFQYQEKWDSLYILSKSNKKFEEVKVLKLKIDNEIYIHWTFYQNCQYIKLKKEEIT